jgi:hypothetical protein
LGGFQAFRRRSAIYPLNFDDVEIPHGRPLTSEELRKAADALLDLIVALPIPVLPPETTAIFLSNIAEILISLGT